MPTILFAFIFLGLCLAFLFWLARIIFVAFIQKKDEREQWIIAKSMQHSFIILFLFYLLQLVFKTISYSYWIKFASGIVEVIYIDPAIFYCVVLGVNILINKRRYSNHDRMKE